MRQTKVLGRETAAVCDPVRAMEILGKIIHPRAARYGAFQNSQDTD